MLNVIIIEDENRCIELLLNNLSSPILNVKIIATLRTVKESLDYLADSPEADVIISNVELTDGFAFEIFTHKWISIPVIFIGGSKEYELIAYENNGIDYLLKTVKPDDLKRALLKYYKLQKHFSKVISNEFVADFLNPYAPYKKNRLVVKKGIENVVLKVEDLVIIYTENKMVYVINNEAKKYICNRNLGELEELLDKRYFFRASRQYILNINYIKSFKPHEKVKLLVDISIPQIKNPIIVSQETAVAFRKWVHEV